MKNLFIGLCYFWFDLWFEIKSWSEKTKRFIWNRGIKLQWNRLWVREDEFHRSLDMDFDAMLGMGKKRRDTYLKDLIKRRQIAHEKDLIRTSPAYRAIVEGRKI